MLKKFLVYLLALSILMSVAVFSSTAEANDTSEIWIEVPFIGWEFREYNLWDASRTLKYIAGWDIDIRFFYGAYDMDDNGTLNLSDVSIMLKRIAGWDIQYWDIRYMK